LTNKNNRNKYEITTHPVSAFMYTDIVQPKY
jgi:hypothetical protein